MLLRAGGGGSGPLTYGKVRLVNGPYNTASGGNHDTIQFDTVVTDVYGLWNPNLTGRAVNTIVNGGAGYTIGDVLTDAGGAGTPNFSVTVTNVAAGVVTAVTILNAGLYAPLNAASVVMNMAGGTGAGCQLYVLWAGCGFICPAGFHFFEGRVNASWASNNTGRRQLSIRKNYTGITDGSPQDIAAAVTSAGDTTAINTSTGIIAVTAGDILTANVIQTSGGNLAISQGIGAWFEGRFYRKLIGS